MTSYNCEETIELCLASLTEQLDEKYEIIIVDNYSTDNTLEKLTEWSKNSMISIIQAKSSRGLGRHIGVEMAKGEYIISQLDCDEEFKPILQKITTIYESRFSDILLTFNKDEKIMFFVAPRKLLSQVGNYRDLNYHEDRDLYWRCHQIGKFGYYGNTEYLVQKHQRGKKFSWRVLKRIYHSSIDSFRMGDLPPHLKKIKIWSPLIWVSIPIFYILSKLEIQFDNDNGIKKFKEIQHKVN